MSVTVDLQGFKELEQELDRLSKSAGKGVLRRALKKSAEPMADLARSMAPDDPSTKGFDLKKSIIYGTKLSHSEKRSHRRMFRDDRASVEGFVGAGPLPQAIHMEFGTAPFISGGMFKGAKNPGVSPQPFMRPAWDADKLDLLDRLGKEMWREFEKSVKRAERKAAREAAKG